MPKKSPTKPAPAPALELVPAGDAALVVAEPGLSQQFDDARTFLKMAHVSMAQSAAFMVLCGVELNRLHKLHGVRRGKPSANSRNVAGIKWPELVEREMGISEDTAARYMNMAQAAKKKIPELNAEELLNTPLNALPDLRREKLIKSVQKITDGQTAQQLMWDWGIAKKPHGHGLQKQGGDRGGRRGKLTAEQQEALENEAALTDRDTLIEAAAQVMREKSWRRWPAKGKDRKALETLFGELTDINAQIKTLLAAD